MKQRVLLYTKKVKNTKVNDKGQVTTNTFEMFLVRYNGLVFDATMKADLKDKRFFDDMKQLKYPVYLTLGDGNNGDNKDYFMNRETYTRKDGTLGEKYIVCIMDYRSIEQGEFPPQQNIDDIVKKRMSQDNITQHFDNDEKDDTNGELPF